MSVSDKLLYYNSSKTLKGGYYADEPVSALDVFIYAQVINLPHDLKNQVDLYYLFISHDLSIVEFINDRIAVMYLGKIVEFAATQVLFDCPPPNTQALLSAIPGTSRTKVRSKIILKEELSNPINLPPECHFHT